MGIVQYLHVMLFVLNLTFSTVPQKAVNSQIFKFRPHGTAYARELRKISDMRRIAPFLCLLLSSTLLKLYR